MFTLRHSILVVLLLLSTWAHAQYRGVVVSADSKKPVAGAVVRWTNSRIGTITDESGRYAIEKNKSGYTVQSLGYYDYVGMTLPDTVFLQPESYVLPAISISDEPDSVFGNKRYSVGDYVWWKGELLLVLYEHEKYFKRTEETRDLFEEAWLARMDSTGKITSSFHINEPAEALHLSPTGDCFLKTEKSVFHITENPAIQLDYVDPATFTKELEPICGFLRSNIVFSNFSKAYPAFSYFHVPAEMHEAHIITTVADSFTMELFHSEFKYLSGRGKRDAFQYELDYGIPKEVIAGYMSGFKDSPYYHDPVAYFVQKENTWTIYNCSQRCILIVDEHGHVLANAKMGSANTLADLAEERKILNVMAREDGQTVVFAQDKLGVCGMYEVNEVGEVTHQRDLYWKFVKNPKTKGDQIFYLYRPYESRKNFYLYAE